MASPLSKTVDAAVAGGEAAGARKAVRLHDGDIAELAPDWKACAASALAPSGAHLHPWLAASFRHLRMRHPARLLTIWRGRMLTGAMALETGLWRWGFPCRAAGNWQSPLAFEGTPLICAAAAKPAVDALLTSHGGAVLRLDAIPADGPFWDTLQERARSLGAPIEILRRWERAALRPARSFSDWFEGNFERKRRKEYRRLRMRLGEQGRLESLAWRQGELVAAWLDELATLEAKGWKGRRGTALQQDAAIMATLAEALPALGEQGNLRFWKIALDGRPIAMMFAIVSGEAGWLGKIAFDEDFAKYSPGALLILDATESFIGEGGIRAVDSCAMPGHSMIENIWRDRVALCDVLIGAPRGSPLLFGMVVAAERLRRRARQAAKDLFYSVTKRRQS